MPSGPVREGIKVPLATRDLRRSKIRHLNFQNTATSSLLTPMLVWQSLFNGFKIALCRGTAGGLGGGGEGAGGGGCAPTGPAGSSRSVGEEQKEGKAAIFSCCPTGPEVRKKELYLKPPWRERIKGANKTTQSRWLCNGMTVMSQPLP